MVTYHVSSSCVRCVQVEARISEHGAVCGQELLDTRPWARALGVGVEAQQLPLTVTNSREE